MISALHVLIMSIAYRFFRCKGQGVFFFLKKGLSVWVGLIIIQNEKVPAHRVAMQLLDKHATTLHAAVVE
jgi:hypothetical protein